MIVSKILRLLSIKEIPKKIIKILTSKLHFNIRLFSHESQLLFYIPLTPHVYPKKAKKIKITHELNYWLLVFS